MTQKRRFTFYSQLFAALGCVLTLLATHQTASGQKGQGYGNGEQVQGLTLGARANPFDGPKEELRKPTQLLSNKGKLELDLYLGYRLVFFKVAKLEKSELKRGFHNHEKYGWVNYYEDPDEPKNNGIYREARLRSYYTYRKDDQVDSQRLIGPTLSVGPSDQLVVNLHNRLPLNGAELIYDRQLLKKEDVENLNDGKLPEAIVKGLEEIERKQPIKYRDADILPLEGQYTVKVARESLEWIVTPVANARTALGKETAFERLQIIRKETPIQDDMDCTIYGLNKQIDDRAYVADGDLTDELLQDLNTPQVPKAIQQALFDTERVRNYGSGRLYARARDPERKPIDPIVKVVHESREWQLTWPAARTLYERLLIVSDEREGKRRYTIYGVNAASHESGDHQDHNEPHDFNRTNLHVHGWQVSPHQDDVLREVQPSFSSRYAYTLDKHTSGTYWYHPHIHGSTALQVSSGVSGLLIVKGGAIDKVPEIKAASDPKHEKHMVFNEIVYNSEQRIWIRAPLPGQKPTPNDKLGLRYVGLAPSYKGLLDDAEAHPPNGVTINGQIKPIITMRPGEVQRWRMLQSGYHSALAFELVEEGRAYDNKNTDRIQFCQFAVDGINFKRPRMINGVYLAPGNRTDVLVKAPEDAAGKKYILRVLNYQGKGEYFPGDIDEKMMKPEHEGYLATVVINDKKMKKPMKLLPLDQDLPEHRHGFEKLDKSNEVVRTRKTEFNINFRVSPERFEVNGAVFDPEEISEEPVAGTVEAWEVSSAFNIHPYHIHINPFQVVAYRVWDGTLDDPRTPDINERKGEYIEKLVDPPMWKDTAMVMGPVPPQEANRDERIRLLTHYDERFSGGFVMHCHVLYHEDKGMMQRIRILDPREGQIRNLITSTAPLTPKGTQGFLESALQKAAQNDAENGTGRRFVPAIGKPADAASAPQKVKSALRFYKEHVEDADFGSAKLYTVAINQTSIYVVHVTTDGDDGWLEAYNETGDGLAFARFGYDSLEFHDQKTIRSDL